VLGWGAIARRAFHPALQASNAGRLTAVASERGDAAEIEGSLPGVAVHTGAGAYEALLRRDDVDAVYIAVPNHRHAALTEAAAAEGKHVLCEKPLGVDAQQATRMADRCAAAGVVLMEAIMARFNPQHARVRELIAEGAIGRPRLFRSSFTVRLPDAAGDIRFLPEPGAGALYDVGIYPISAARWIFDAEPEAVAAATLDLPGTGADELGGLLLSFPDARIAVIDYGLTLETADFYEVVGGDGSIRVARPYASPPFAPAESSLALTIARGGETEVERFEDLNQYVLQLHAFQQALDGGELLYPPEQSIRTARVIDACRRAAAEGPGALVAVAAG
jgi:predicted dehydrogenase